MKRFKLLTGAAAVALTLLATACSGGDTTDEASNEEARAGGEITVAENTFMTSLDSDVGFAGYSLTAFGIAESLMRITADSQVEPWVAESVERVDELTLEVTIRDDVTFWDGTKVDAAAIQKSLERSIAEQPGTANLLPPESTFAADGQVLTITTPRPVGSLVNNLASFNFAIKKIEPDGTITYTGPYTYSDYVEQTSITLTGYPEHRTPPKLDKIFIRYIPDVSARALALQAGDVDLAQGLLPSHAEQLSAAGFQVFEFPSGRQDDLVFNINAPPLNEVEVRQAISLAIDRQQLLDGVLNGSGTVATALAPESIGLAGVVSTQEHDPQDAARVLDEAGWKPGADGIREKNGTKLAFTLGYYTQRAELEPLATVIKDQLAAVGVAVSLQSIADINTAMAENGFDATLYSYTIAPYGEIGRAISQLYTPSGSNKGRYTNEQANALFEAYQTSVDDTKREDLLVQIQELIGNDVPVVYLVNPNQIVAASPEVAGYSPHPLENYKIDSEIGLR